MAAGDINCTYYGRSTRGAARAARNFHNASRYNVRRGSPAIKSRRRPLAGQMRDPYARRARFRGRLLSNTRPRNALADRRVALFRGESISEPPKPTEASVHASPRTHRHTDPMVDRGYRSVDWPDRSRYRPTIGERPALVSLARPDEKRDRSVARGYGARGTSLRCVRDRRSSGRASVSALQDLARAYGGQSL